ncbi:hypothetical protein C8J57DRAFT_1320471 [Mycena rebaudengoi]|nr:hypothetical protein C8J57DRAFT_1320471 [Mycena rebaudengoi]
MNVPKPGIVTPLQVVGSLQVEESRTKRLERQQARLRDRGGIFVPRQHNNLLDILLGKKKLSPLKRRSRSRSLSCSPIKKVQKAKAARKSGGVVSKASGAKKSGKKAVDEGDDAPVAGPSRLPNTKKTASTKAPVSRKGKKATVSADDDTVSQTKAAPKRRGRPAKSKQTTMEESDKPTPKSTAAKRKAKQVSDERTAEHSDDELQPAPTKKSTATKAKASRKRLEDEAVIEKKPSKSASDTAAKGKIKAASKPKAAKVDADDADPGPISRPQRSRAAKTRTIYAELSDDEEADEQPKSVRSKVAAAKQNPMDPAPMSSKQKGKQREVEDDVPPEFEKSRSTVGSTSKAKARKPEDAEEPPSKPKVKSKTSAKKHALEPDPPEEDEDDRPAAKRHKPVPRKEKSDAPTRLEAILEEDEEEEVPSVKLPVKKDGVKARVAPASSRKRPREPADDVSEAVAQTTRKRAKVAEPAETPAPAPAPVLAPAKPKKRVPAKRSKVSAAAGVVAAEKHVPIPSRTLKENTPTRQEKSKSAAAKPALLPLRKGPPKSVLDRVLSHSGSRLVDDSEPDELDFLS